MTADVNGAGLAGRTVVVAGAGGGGIGTAVCDLLGRAGAAVVALDVDDERLDAARDVLSRHGGPFAARCADVRDPTALDALLDEALTDLPPLHGLAHVAGGIGLDQWQPTRDVTLDSWRRVLELNFDAPLTTGQLVARRLLAAGHGGSIVYIASVAALFAAPFTAAYTAAKAGLVSLTRTQAVEWGPFGIRVNAVAPGSIRTPRKVALGSTAADDAIERDAIPMGRRGRPDEIAGAVVFLTSAWASFVSGQVLAVDGASSAKPSYVDATGLPVFVRDAALRERLDPRG